MIPYGRQDISQEDIDAVIEVLKSDWLTQGPLVPRFEKAMAGYGGARYGVAVNSATSALHIACLALGLKSGDWLWTSPNTFVASSNVGLYCGATIDFVDIDPKSYNMSVEALSRKLEAAEAEGRLPKVVIPVHFAGQCCDMREIHRLSKQYKFRVIEDASHAVGGHYSGEAIGSCQFSDITIFSFHPVKIITTGEGGVALTNDSTLAEKMARLRSHGITNESCDMAERPEDEIWNYQQVDLGFNYRMTDISAALGLSQLTRLDQFVKQRRALAKRYDEELARLPITIPWQHPDTRSSYHLYPIRVNKDSCGRTQKQVYEALRASQILVNIHYIPVHRQPFYEELGFSAGYCPEAEKHHREVIILPMYPGLMGDPQSRVIDELKKVLA